jgi:hypothetical protein
MTFSEFQINLANFAMHIGQISLAQNVGKIKLQIFLPNAVRRKLFAWPTKVGEIDP